MWTDARELVLVYFPLSSRPLKPTILPFSEVLPRHVRAIVPDFRSPGPYIANTLVMPLSSVLIVGGCGFLGHHIVKLFQELHPETSISVLDLRTNTNRFDKVTYYDGDITDNKRVAEVLRDCGPQVVVNTVSPVYGFGAEVYFKVNVEGTRVLLEECAKANVQAFVFTSSASVVFNGMYDVRNADETAPYASPHMDAYNDSKVCDSRSNFCEFPG